MAAAIVKPYEDIMTIIKDVKKIFDEDNVEIIEEAKTRARVIENSTDVLMKDRGLVTNNMYALARTYPANQKDAIIEAYRNLTNAQLNYYLRHPEIYIPRAGYPNHGGKRRHRSRKGRKSSKRKSRKN